MVILSLGHQVFTAILRCSEAIESCDFCGAALKRKPKAQIGITWARLSHQKRA